MKMHAKVSEHMSRDILESAHAFFLNKGFEKTTVTDICNNLNISVSQFGMCFKSLDEVLETLWSRSEMKKNQSFQ